MKINSLLLLTFSIFTLSLHSCLKDSCQRKITYTRVDPVYKTLNEIRQSQVVYEAPRQLKNPGGLYFYNNLILINERREGIHIIDNTEPSSPIPLAFLAIPGNENMAVRNGLLYANNYIDLLAIDLQDYSVKGRAESVFPPLWEDVANNRLAVYYEEKEVTEELDCNEYGRFYQEDGAFFDFSNVASSDITTFQNEASNGKQDGAGTGIGGSMARFTIVGDYMYAVDESNLNVFTLAQPELPAKTSTVPVGWEIETIFPYEDKLFIGSGSGMFIFDNSNPSQPVQLSAFAHARACDPVFVQDHYAYVTLRSGTACEGFTNQLDLIDISNITNPILLKSFPMENPHGLSIKENHLFLCEGSFGLKSFDISDRLHLDDNLLDTQKNIHAYDAIALPGDKDVVLVIGQDGFYQYDAEDASDLKLLSKIGVNK